MRTLESFRDGTHPGLYAQLLQTLILRGPLEEKQSEKEDYTTDGLNVSSLYSRLLAIKKGLNQCVHKYSLKGKGVSIWICFNIPSRSRLPAICGQ